MLTYLVDSMLAHHCSEPIHCTHASMHSAYITNAAGLLHEQKSQHGEACPEVHETMLHKF